MREIKFRAWDEKRKCFEYWGIGEFDGDGAGCKFPSLSQTKLPQMQYTGLKDKNGVEIYEGDILEAVYQSDLREVTLSRGVVTYYEEDAAFFSKVFEETKSTTSETITRKTGGWDKVNHHTVKVIGNIYENKELLK